MTATQQHIEDIEQELHNLTFEDIERIDISQEED